jgi:hypothetical protein
MKQSRSKSLSGELKQPTDKPVLLEAIEITIRTIEDRARLYRNLVMAVSVVSVLSILLSVLFRHWLPLIGLVLLVPLTGAYLFFDGRLVRRWRAGVVEMTRLRSLDVATFLKTISGFRHLPSNSLKAMLATLPFGGQEGRQPEQALVGSTFDAIDHKNELKILCSTSLLTFALGCLIAGTFYGSAALLLSGGSLIVLLVVFGRR